MIRFNFNEKKTTQIASEFLKLNGGKMNHMKLVKLIYLSDRESLCRWNRPLTGDDYYSLPHGPILSRTLNVLNRLVAGPYWQEYVTERSGNTVCLQKSCPVDQLSHRELKLLGELFEKFREYSEFQLRDYCHALPEYKDPGRSRIPILVEDILRAQKKTEEEILQIGFEEECLGEIERFSDT
jgi:uncharacterized phage-associated protein